MKLRQQQAFTLLEVMVSAAIFTIISAMMASSFVTMMQTNTKSEIRTGALLAAQKVLDEIRVLDPSALPASGSSTQSVTSGGRTYSVTTTYCPVATYCTSNNIRQIRVGVTYNAKSYCTIDTVYSQLR